MILITNGKTTFEVTKGAFNAVFKKQGYTVVEKDSEASKNEDDGLGDTQRDPGGAGDGEDDISALEEKPISQWSKDEVKRYAAAKGINLFGTASVNEAKKRIKAAMG